MAKAKRLHVPDMKNLHLEHLGGSCITDIFAEGRRDTDYDGSRDFNSFTIEKGERQ